MEMYLTRKERGYVEGFLQGMRSLKVESIPLNDKNGCFDRGLERVQHTLETKFKPDEYPAHLFVRSIPTGLFPRFINTIYSLKDYNFFYFRSDKPQMLFFNYDSRAKPVPEDLAEIYRESAKEFCRGADVRF